MQQDNHEQATRQDAVKQTLAALSTQFPKCFRKRLPLEPLKEGILQDLFTFYADNSDPMFSKTKLRQAVKYYTNGRHYLARHKEGRKRIDLEGKACGLVSEEQEQYAAGLTKEYKRYQLERKQTKRKQSIANKKSSTVIYKKPTAKKTQQWQSVIKLNKKSSEEVIK